MAKFRATRFLIDSNYREKEGIPALKQAMSRAWKGMAQETRETFRAMGQLIAMADGRKLASEEKAQLKEQLSDLVKAAPMLTVFMLPGGLILLPILLKVLPFDLRLSGFKDQDEIVPEGDPSSEGEASPGRETPPET